MADDEHDQLARQTGMVLRTSVQVAMQVAEALARRREQTLRTAAAAPVTGSGGPPPRTRRSSSPSESRTPGRTPRRSPTGPRPPIEDRLRTDKGIDLTALRDTVNTAVVAAAVERELADRAEHERQVDQSAERSVLGEPESPSTSPAHHLPSSTVEWDTARRREQHRAELTTAGLDTEAVDAHLLTDTANVAALDAASIRAPATAPTATTGERGHDLDRSMDRGGR